MPFQDFVYWAFQGIIAGSAVFIAKNLSELNIKIAVIVEKVAGHEKQLEKHDERIREIELTTKEK